MALIYSCILIIVGFMMLVTGADYFVSNASGIAKKLGISLLVIGLTIVAFGTSMPELAVSVTAALEGANEIAVGNVLGSNIFNLLMVAGSSACFFPLVTNPTLMKRDWPLSTIAAIVLTIFVGMDAYISRMEAAILIVMFVCTMFMQLRAKNEETQKDESETRKMSQLIIWLVVGVIGIVVGGQLTVDGACELARILGLSETLIGLTIVAVGTSLPELVTSVVAARKGENEIAMGNVIGSNLFNLLCILGISAFVHPITVASTAFIDAMFLSIVSIVFWLIAKYYRLNRPVGMIMMTIYVAYMIYIICR